MCASSARARRATSPTQQLPWPVATAPARSATRATLPPSATRRRVAMLSTRTRRLLHTPRWRPSSAVHSSRTSHRALLPLRPHNTAQHGGGPGSPLEGISSASHRKRTRTAAHPHHPEGAGAGSGHGRSVDAEELFLRKRWHTLCRAGRRAEEMVWRCGGEWFSDGEPLGCTVH
jgi:hypothetical protein